MAQYNSDSFEGMSSLPTNSHAAMVMAHRCAMPFTVATALAVGDLIYLGALPVGYTIEGIKVDSDGIAELKADILLLDPENNNAETKVVTGASFIDAGVATQVLDLKATRHKGTEHKLHIVAKVTAAASVAKGQEIGVTVQYKYRQVAY